MMNREYPGECIVPINEKGIKELNDMSYDYTENMIVFKVSVEETKDFFKLDGPSWKFDELDPSGMGFEIDEYETGLIPFEYLGRCLAIMQQYSKFPDGAIAQALKTALNYGTCVEVTF